MNPRLAPSRSTAGCLAEGPSGAPAQVSGSAHVGRASVNCPFLKYPITNFGGAVLFEDGALRIEGLDARVGRRGHVHLKGALPVQAARR